MTLDDSFTIAAVQACPVYLDRERTIDKACDLVAEAGRHGARLVVFPEAFVPAYPLWSWFVPAGRTSELRDLYSRLHAAGAIRAVGVGHSDSCRADLGPRRAVAVDNAACREGEPMPAIRNVDE